MNLDSIELITIILIVAKKIDLSSPTRSISYGKLRHEIQKKESQVHI